MTTQNVNQHRTTFPGGTGAGTYYGPCATGVASPASWTATQANAYIEMDGFDHLSIQGTITAVGAATAVLTVWSDDGSGTWTWVETLGSYESTTNAFAAAYTGTGGVTTAFHLHLDDCDGKRFQVRLVTSDNTAAMSTLTFRRTKA